MVDLTTLLQPEAKHFVSAHLEDDLRQLMLQRDRYPSLPVDALVAQIQARQKAKTKLPSWFANSNLLLAPGLAMEQCSSEHTATYKTSLVHGSRLIDLTGGAGVDTYYMSHSFGEVIYVEQDPDLCAYARHNFKMLKADRIKVVNQKAEAFLSSIAPSSADTIYLDPARRINGQKVFRLEDSSPQVLKLLPLLLSRANTILLKTAPWLDIKAVLRNLRLVAEVHVVAVNNECKEVLYLIKEAPASPIRVATVNIGKSGVQQKFAFTYEEEEQAKVEFAKPQNWVYEPNAAILKAGAFKSVAEKFAVSKLETNTHLYTSAQLVEAFPGRIFSIERVIDYKLKEVKTNLPQNKVNLAVRNFPDTVAQIRKRTGLKEGGDQYVFATRGVDRRPIMIIAKKHLS